MGVWISSFSALLQFISVDDVDIAWCISDYRHPKFGMQIGQLHQANRGHCVKWRPSTPQVYWHIDIDITFANIITCVCVHHVMMSCHVMSWWSRCVCRSLEKCRVLHELPRNRQRRACTCTVRRRYLAQAQCTVAMRRRQAGTWKVSPSGHF